VRDALAKTDYTKNTGTLVLPTDKLFFDAQGQNPNAPLFIVQVQKGELIPVWPGTYAASKVQIAK